MTRDAIGAGSVPPQFEKPPIRGRRRRARSGLVRSHVKGGPVAEARPHQQRAVDEVTKGIPLQPRLPNWSDARSRFSENERTRPMGIVERGGDLRKGVAEIAKFSGQSELKYISRKLYEQMGSAIASESQIQRTHSHTSTLDISILMPAASLLPANQPKSASTAGRQRQAWNGYVLAHPTLTVNVDEHGFVLGMSIGWNGPAIERSTRS